MLENALKTIDEIKAVETLRPFGFKASGCALALAPGVYSEVVSRPAITALPHAPAHFLGVINLRGSIVPVYRLDTDARRPDPFQVALAIGQGEHCAALMIDALPRRLTVETQTEVGDTSALPKVLGGSVSGQYTLADASVWYAVDHLHLFTQLCGT